VVGDRLVGGIGRAADAAAQNATALGYVAGWRLVRWLPEPAARAAFDRIAGEIYRRDGRGVQRLRSNLGRVRPDLGPDDRETLTRDAVRSYLRYWCEAFRLPAWPTDDLLARSRTVNEQAFRDLYARGDGVVVALPHMANWDWAGAWAGLNDMPLVTVAERLEPARLYDEFVAYRASLGMEILPLTGDDASFRRLQEFVADGGLVCLLADRDLSRTSVEVELCGEPARMPRGPAVLARRTGAPLVPVTLAYDGDGMEITFHDPVPREDDEDGVARMMQGVADAFSSAIRAHPADWHMMQKVFLADLPRRRTEP
jgi:lauroyl/myristoyl acyltransferase